MAHPDWPRGLRSTGNSGRRGLCGTSRHSLCSSMLRGTDEGFINIIPGKDHCPRNDLACLAIVIVSQLWCRAATQTTCVSMRLVCLCRTAVSHVRDGAKVTGDMEPH